MSGQPTPPVLLEAFALNAPVCTPAAPVAGGKTSPFPVPSQAGTVNGAASLNDGFPPLTMTDPTSGGVAPFGCDANGILYLLSSHIAALNAGQRYTYNAALSAAMGGYALGAVLQQTADPTAFWINMTAGNTSNPDTGGAGWMSTKPLYQSKALAAGNNNNVSLGAAGSGASDYVLDLDASAGSAVVTGIVAQRDGQTLVIRRKDATANTLSLASLNSGSAGANQFQIVGAGISLNTQYGSAVLRYSSTLGFWVQVSSS